MKITFDDWLVIIEWNGTVKVYNTEAWPEWGDVNEIDDYDVRMQAIEYLRPQIIQAALNIWWTDVYTKTKYYQAHWG